MARLLPTECGLVSARVGDFSTGLGQRWSVGRGPVSPNLALVSTDLVLVSGNFGQVSADFGLLSSRLCKLACFVWVLPVEHVVGLGTLQLLQPFSSTQSVAPWGTFHPHLPTSLTTSEARVHLGHQASAPSRRAIQIAPSTIFSCVFLLRRAAARMPRSGVRRQGASH